MSTTSTIRDALRKTPKITAAAVLAGHQALALLPVAVAALLPAIPEASGASTRRRGGHSHGHRGFARHRHQEGLLGRLSEELRLASMLDHTAAERKVLLLGWLLAGHATGPGSVPRRLLGAPAILKFFGADYYEEHEEEGEQGASFLYVLLDERYDEQLDAVFQIGAELEAGREEDAVYFVTTYAPCLRPAQRGAEPVCCAFWDDATQALISYYGTGSAERARRGSASYSDEEDGQET